MPKQLTLREARRIEDQEDLLIDVQFLIQEVRRERRMSKAALAKKAGLTLKELSALLSAEADPKLKLVARVFHALGRKGIITVKTKRRS